MTPQYTKAEQRERMKEFERLVKNARHDWRRGQAVVILSFHEWRTLTEAQLRLERVRALVAK